jgi:hypothetical protein
VTSLKQSPEVFSPVRGALDINGEEQKRTPPILYFARIIRRTKSEEK